MKKIVLATGNKGKVAELADMLSPLKMTVIPQTELHVSEVAETGTTFVENAIIKARHAAKITGLPAIADDSGLVVPILNGAPGIYSARYSEQATDQANIDKLITKLDGEQSRAAYFQCALVMMQHCDDPTPIICQGRWHGEITLAPSGESGFGYDPVFFIPTLNKTAAELSKQQKNQLSHRGQALQQLLKELTA